MSKAPAQEEAVHAYGWAARDSSGILSPYHFTRRANGDNDITIKIQYCGICHGDIHLVKSKVWSTIYPTVPGHEIVGQVTKVGLNVKKFKVGDVAGVGCMMGSCGSCENCKQDLENYCPKMLWTFNGQYEDGTRAFGGYSDKFVVEEHFAVRIPNDIPLAGVAPLLCAGITVYSPLKYFGLVPQPGSKKHLGVVGLGGVGHMAVKFAKAFGAKVTVISSSPSKEKEAVERLGADSFLISHDHEKLEAALGTMDGIIDTVSASHSLLPLIGLLKTSGKLILVGAPVEPPELPVFPLIMGRKVIAGSAIGGMKETQEMIDFAAKHNITADVEVIPMDYVNTALERLEKGDNVRYRFVIDVANMIKCAN
ncbi:probable mannitol dehydrogenase [Rosa rugosa]|uniref:probable mannitol dehydrogenase n=1 Tax=Rosa rugosa TaxID=74645 RepID=UPI002B402206|nr:probable mannitol dehydrogenase [Rosa rugosa]